MPTETRTFIGESAGQIFDGFASFRIDQHYELHIKRSDGNVSVMFDHHEHTTPGAGLVMSKWQCEK